MNIIYRSWRNLDVTKTVSHPYREPSLGGIHHLPLKEQWAIKKSEEVKPALCCQDPEWLFRIYQDTIVDVDEVIGVVRDALVERKRRIEEGWDRVRSSSLYASVPYPHALQPSEIRNVSCEFVACPGAEMAHPGDTDDDSDDNLCAFLSFLSPLNWPHILDVDKSTDVFSPNTEHVSSSNSTPTTYEVWFQPVDSTDGDSVLSFFISDNFRYFSKAKDGVDSEVDYYVWVRIVHGHLQGPFPAKPADCSSL